MAHWDAEQPYQATCRVAGLAEGENLVPRAINSVFSGANLSPSWANSPRALVKVAWSSVNLPSMLSEVVALSRS